LMLEVLPVPGGPVRMRCGMLPARCGAVMEVRVRVK
jgi:hypothetical protein